MKNVKNIFLTLLIIHSFALKNLGGITIQQFREDINLLINLNRQSIRQILTEITDIEFQIDALRVEKGELEAETVRALYAQDARIYKNIAEKKEEIISLENKINVLHEKIRLANINDRELRDTYKEEQQKFNEREKLRNKLETKEDFIAFGMDPSFVYSVNKLSDLLQVAFVIKEINSSDVSDVNDDFDLLAADDDDFSSTDYGSDSYSDFD